MITPSLVTVVEKRGIREVNPRTQVYHAVHPYLTQAIHYTLLKFKDMAFVWFGSSAGGLKSMTAAMPMPTIRVRMWGEGEGGGGKMLWNLDDRH